MGECCNPQARVTVMLTGVNMLIIIHTWLLVAKIKLCIPRAL